MGDYRIDGFFAPDSVTDDIEDIAKRLDDYAKILGNPKYKDLHWEAAARLRSLKAERDEARDEMGSMDAHIVDLRSRLTALEGALRMIWDATEPTRIFEDDGLETLAPTAIGRSTIVNMGLDVPALLSPKSEVSE